jgi:AraC-like DNA-binding protein
MTSLTTAEPGIAFFGPPYVRFEREQPPSFLDPVARRGYAMIWYVADATRQEEELARVRSRLPGVPLVMLLPPPSAFEAALPLINSIPILDPRSVLPAAVMGNTHRIRQALTAPPRSLADGVVRYLLRRGIVADPHRVQEIQRILELAPDTPSISRLCRRMYTSRRTLGRHFAAAGLPVPSHWLQFARLLYIHVRLQVESGAAFRIANRAGYPDGFTMSNQMKRLTGVRPSEARKLLSWEWFLEAWLMKEGVRGD